MTLRSLPVRGNRSDALTATGRGVEEGDEVEEEEERMGVKVKV